MRSGLAAASIVAWVDPGEELMTPWMQPTCSARPQRSAAVLWASLPLTVVSTSGKEITASNNPRSRADAPRKFTCLQTLKPTVLGFSAVNRVSIMASTLQLTPSGVTRVRYLSYRVVRNVVGSARNRGVHNWSTKRLTSQ